MTVCRIGVAKRWSDAVVAGGFLFLSGHIADKTRGGSVEQQTEEILRDVEDTLAQAGMTKDDLVSVQIFLADISGLDEMNAAWDRWISPESPPARATVEARLVYPDLSVEVTGVAFR